MLAMVRLACFATVCLASCSFADTSKPIEAAEEAAVTEYASSASAFVLGEKELSERISAANAGDVEAARVVADHYEEGLQNRPVHGTLWRLRAARLGDAKSLFVSSTISIDMGLCAEGIEFAQRLLASREGAYSEQMRRYLTDHALGTNRPCYIEASKFVAGLADVHEHLPTLDVGNKSR